ncbi:hypothetical protein IEN92_07895 [Polynucleobacter sp. MWH-Creno-3A4]|uniref:hypothetical protein n=1 Tax=Polynucleobacter sp. MWH-Creno-3A4 TaxID=1855886 RepID=UPI001C0C7F74|nr:hypothetical protein [Polynucleobacter sp. MWH-Creno-3A4]MBU3606673.1 hypothetical protein [Polynucleobacter sp. MWH-Creno-3A4]
MNIRRHKLIFLGLIFGYACTSFAQSFKFVAIGDMPYNPPKDYVRYERLITEINRLKPSFTLFIGDTKSGSSNCSDEFNQLVKNYFNQFNGPLIYSVGDNEWTDCHRPLAGSYDPLERLARLRQTFFQNKMSLGKQALQLTRQSDLDPQYSKFVENSSFVKNGVLFVNVHIPGSNNNFERDEAAKAEYRERNQANLSWIKRAFELASTNQYVGLIFFYQADMFYTGKEPIDPESGYRDTLFSLSKHAEELKKPILLIHGDSHRLIIDQPLKTPDQKHALENVLRLQVMGAELIQGVEIEVDPKSEQPFSFTPILLKQNMLHPSP